MAQVRDGVTSGAPAGSPRDGASPGESVRFPRGAAAPGAPSLPTGGPSLPTGAPSLPTDGSDPPPAGPDLIVKGGLVVLEDGPVEADLIVRGGRIAAITAVGEGASPRAAANGGPSPGTASGAAAPEVIDARGLIVLPGAIDTHSHLNDPGLTESEDFFTGTASAAAGGVTTVLEHPLTVPLVADRASFEAKLAEARKKAVVDFALWGAAVPSSLGRLAELARAGAIGLKSFMSYSPEIPALDGRGLLEAMTELAPLGLVHGLHCESEDLAEFYTGRLKAAGRRDPLAYPEGRPEIVELDAIRRAVLLQAATGAKVHVCHTSIASGVREVTEARRRARKLAAGDGAVRVGAPAPGRALTVETCPHYLVLTQETLAEHGPYAKCGPALRSRANVEEMWELLAAGEIDCVGSDHATYTFAEKDVGKGDIWAAPAGVTGIQTMVPLLYSEGVARRQVLSLARLAALVATNAARIFGLYPRKGAIRPGADADLVLLDPAARWTVSPETLFYKMKWTPYMGWTLRGRIRRTIVRGRTVYRDGEITAQPGTGEFLPGPAARAGRRGRDGALAGPAGAERGAGA